MRMFHHLRGHSRTWTFWPAAPRRRTPRTAYGPRLDRLEDRIAMSGVTVSYSTSSAWLLVVGDGADNQIEVRVVKNAGQAPIVTIVTVTNDNNSSSQTLDPLKYPLAGMDVRVGSSESIMSMTADAYTIDVVLSP